MFLHRLSHRSKFKIVIFKQKFKPSHLSVVQQCLPFVSYNSHSLTIRKRCSSSKKVDLGIIPIFGKRGRCQNFLGFLNIDEILRMIYDYKVITIETSQDKAFRGPRLSNYPLKSLETNFVQVGLCTLTFVQWWWATTNFHASRCSIAHDQ